MARRSPLATVAAAAAAGAAVAAAGYAAYVAFTWARYGRPARSPEDAGDELLDRFLPSFDVVERHQTEVDAPAAVTLAVARDLDLESIPLVRAIFRARELILGSAPLDRPIPRGLVASTLALGWGVLAEDPGREIVIGAVTRPWEPNPVFRALPPEEFAGFNEPDYVKIVWNLRADPIGEGRSLFRTETRAAATDAGAREKFRIYWACLSPGIRLIRRMTLEPVRREAARQAHAQAGSCGPG